MSVVSSSHYGDCEIMGKLFPQDDCTRPDYRGWNAKAGESITGRRHTSTGWPPWVPEEVVRQQLKPTCMHAPACKQMRAISEGLVLNHHRAQLR